MNSNQKSIPQDRRIKNSMDAYDVAIAERPYRELEIHAKNLKLGHVAVDIAKQAVAAGDSVQSSPTHREHENTEPFPIIARSFREARSKTEKRFSDTFIDDAIEYKIHHVKLYLDQVPMDDSDLEIARKPARIAELYGSTSEMLLRNLNFMCAQNASSERLEQIKTSIVHYKRLLKQQIPMTESKITAWCDDYKKNDFPVGAVEYQGFRLNGQDLLDIETKCPPDLEPNFKIQRQTFGTFIMAYSNARIIERKSSNRNKEPNRRIYLNPRPEAAPSVFEEILQMANAKGLNIQLKMLQRAPELANRFRALQRTSDDRGSIRGDGIVIYVNEAYEDEALEEVLQIVEKHADEFRGRKVSRVPAPIAEGVSIGDEPVGLTGSESLTSHRAELISRVLHSVRQSGLTGKLARDMFRAKFSAQAKKENVNPDNFAFND